MDSSTITITITYPEGARNPIELMNQIRVNKLPTDLKINARDPDTIIDNEAGKEQLLQLIAHAVCLHSMQASKETTAELMKELMQAHPQWTGWL